MRKIEPEIIVIDEQNAAIARNSSWLCEIFQENHMSVDDKKYIIRDLVENFKRIRNEQIERMKTCTT